MTKQPAWPLHSVGPHTPIRPLSAPLLRLIPGSPRHNQPAIQWLEPAAAEYLHPDLNRFQLTACLDADEATLSINTVDSSKWFKSRFDFLVSSATTPSSTQIHFTLSQNLTYELKKPLCLGSLLLDDIPLDAGEICCTLYRYGENGTGHGTPVARLRLTYIHTTPSPHDKTATSDLRNEGCSTPTTPFAPRFTGHRGMGSSGPHAPHRPVENGIESFAHAACTTDDRVRTVELDVQLTKDNEAVVYHDWFFRPRDEDGYPVYDHDSVRIPIRNLTTSQFDYLFHQSVHDNKNRKKRATMRRQHMNGYQNGNKPRSPLSPFPHQDRQLRPCLLRDVVNTLPEDVGILVELKYPAPNVQEMYSLPYPPRDFFVNTILSELFAHGLPQRKIAFLCFEPDICDMLALKQDSFPVYFSHCETLDKPCDEFDPRTVSLSVGFDFVKNYKLHGLMLLNKLITKRPQVISDIVSENIPIITYGSSNSDPAVVKAQFDAGVTGIIADDIHDMLKELTI